MKGKWDAAKREALKKGAAAKQAARFDQRRDRDEDEGPTLIWGIHAVDAALRNPARPFVQMWATDNAALRLADAIAIRGVRPEPATPRDLDQRLGADTVHQGVLLEAGPLPDRDPGELAAAARGRGPIVILDQVTDPHNVGAILRSAAVFDSAGLLMTRRNSPPLAGVLAKAASGAVDHVPVALATNLARAMAELKAAGVLLVGLDGQGERLLDDIVLPAAGEGRAIALVLGAEGKGLRQLTAETCDVVCRIATDGTLASLNVSNAAAVALHLASMGRRRVNARGS